MSAKFFLCLILIGFWLHLLWQPRRAFHSLAYDNDQWLLVDTQGRTHHFQSLCVPLTMGIGFLLEISNGQKHQTWLVFYDQLNAEAYRYLRVMEHLQSTRA